MDSISFFAVCVYVNILDPMLHRSAAKEAKLINLSYKVSFALLFTSPLFQIATCCNIYEIFETKKRLTPVNKFSDVEQFLITRLF